MAARGHVEHWSVRAGKKEQNQNVISMEPNTRAKPGSLFGERANTCHARTMHIKNALHKLVVLIDRETFVIALSKDKKFTFGSTASLSEALREQN